MQHPCTQTHAHTHTRTPVLSEAPGPSSADLRGPWLSHALPTTLVSRGFETPSRCLWLLAEVSGPHLGRLQSPTTLLPCRSQDGAMLRPVPWPRLPGLSHCSGPSLLQGEKHRLSHLTGPRPAAAAGRMAPSTPFQLGLGREIPQMASPPRLLPPRASSVCWD